MAGYFDIVIAESCTNMALNPVGGDTDNIAASAGTTVTPKSTAYSYLGAFSTRVESNADNEGAQYTLSALSNAIHYVTVRVRGTLPAAWDWSLNGSNYNAPSLLSTEGDWSVYGYSFLAAQANGSTRLDIYQNGAGSGDYYIGHVQVEAKEYATTPVTGDLENCYWTGAKNKSTSVRPAWDRSGGRVYDLDTQYGMYLASYPGIGSPEMERYQTALSLLPGSLDDGHKVLPREFTLIGEQSGTSWANMHYKRKQLIDVLKPDAVKGDQPVTLRYRGANTSRPVEIKAFYLGGMEFTEHEGFTSKQAVRLRANDPYWYDPYETAAHLTVSQSIADADYVVRRINGAWYNISTQFNGGVSALAKGNDEGIFIAGGFTNVGDANGDLIVKWNPTAGTLSSLSTGISASEIIALTAAANGDIYMGGNFAAVGDTDGNYITRWNGSSFNSLSTGLTDIARALCFGLDGTLYVGGAFTNVTDANGDYITKWNGSAFSSLSTGADGIVYAVAVAPNGDIYIGGAFENAGGVATAGIAKWNGSAFSALGAGITGGPTHTVYTIAIDKAGNVYAGGLFTTAGGISCSNIAKWDGSSWEPLGAGTDAQVYSLAFDKSGVLYVGGIFTTAGGLSTADRIAVWNGTTWANLDINLPGSPYIPAIKNINNDIYIGYTTAGIATSSYLNTVTNNGTARAYPKFVVKCNSRDSSGTSIIEYLENATTGYKIWLYYSLLSGETLEINFDPQNLSCKSDFFGDRWDAVLRGSDVADFYLLPGSNSVSAFVNSTTDSSVTSYLLYRAAYESADGGSTA